jgi:hypothetical protein
MNKEKNEKIYDIKNYFKRIYLKSSSNYITKYIDLINEYVIHASENIKIQNIELYIYVFERGIDTLQHIFIMLLMYTRNLDLTYHHCNKAYLYYIEFISQIGEDNNSFLQLNSKDATLFVYKKTIFDINTNIRDSFNQTKSEKICISTVKLIINIYNMLIKTSIKDIDNINLRKEQKNIILIEKETTKIINKLLENNSFLNERVGKYFLEFLYFIDNKKIKYKKKMNIIYIYLKKILHRDNKNIDLITIKLFEKEFDDKLELSPIKIINWLFNFNNK